MAARRIAEREAEARRAEAAKRSWEARWEARPRVETLDIDADATRATTALMRSWET